MIIAALGSLGALRQFVSVSYGATQEKPVHTPSKKQKSKLKKTKNSQKGKLGQQKISKQKNKNLKNKTKPSTSPTAPESSPPQVQQENIAKDAKTTLPKERETKVAPASALNMQSKQTKGEKSKKSQSQPNPPQPPYTPVEMDSDQINQTHPNILVWLIPLGFFAMAGVLIIFQKYQHLLFKGKPSPQDPKNVRPESRAEVALGSVLSSLDLDATRQDDPVSTPESHSSRPKSRIKEAQEKSAPIRETPEEDQHRTKVSGNKPKYIDKSVDTPTFDESPKSENKKIGAPVAIEATLDAPKMDLALSDIETPVHQGGTDSAFLTSPPSAMNWVGNPLSEPSQISDDARMRIKNAAGYQNAVQKGPTSKK